MLVIFTFSNIHILYVSTKASVPALGNQSTFMSLVHFIYILVRLMSSNSSSYPFKSSEFVSSSISNRLPQVV